MKADCHCTPADVVPDTLHRYLPPRANDGQGAVVSVVRDRLTTKPVSSTISRTYNAIRGAGCHANAGVVPGATVPAGPINREEPGSGNAWCAAVDVFARRRAHLTPQFPRDRGYGDRHHDHGSNRQRNRNQLLLPEDSALRADV